MGNPTTGQGARERLAEIEARWSKIGSDPGWHPFLASGADDMLWLCAQLRAALTPTAETEARERIAEYLHAWCGGTPKWEQATEKERFQAYARAEKLMSFLAAASVDAGREREAGWQPIETAPKDGTVVLLFGVPNEVPSLTPHTAPGYWQKDECGFMRPGFWRWCLAVGPSFKVTHWMPLPEARAALPAHQEKSHV